MTIMLLKEAREIAVAYINSDYNNDGDRLVIVDEETIEKEYGWYFFSESERFMRSNDFSDIVLGNSPILVEKETGNIVQFGTSDPIEDQITLYERKLPK